MTDVVTVEVLDDVHMRVLADPGIRQELNEYFAFRPAGYKFSPKYKNRIWDGYIRLYNPMRPDLYVGLLDYLRKFCKSRDYELRVPDELDKPEDIDEDYGYQLAKEVNFPFELRDYQNQYIVNAIKNKRSLSLSPTSSGKSAIMYLIQQHYYQCFGHRTLIIVPTTSLVSQMAGDFVDYGIDPADVHQIKSGASKQTNAPVVISTWQSLVKLPQEWFDQFRVVLGDECHHFKATSLTSIMCNMIHCPYRFGLTGTISSDSKVNRLVLEGLFGPVKRFVSTKDLIDSGTVADFKIKAIVLSHPPQVRKDFNKAVRELEKKKGKNLRYTAEREFLINNESRNNFIKNLVWSLKGQNNLILFDLVEKHGKVLMPLLERDDRQLHFIHGQVKADERERVRHLVENDPVKRHDILASYGVFSTGINLKKLDNVIFASASKSEIKVLQSIGRVLRKGNDADEATLYDLTDDLSTKSRENYTLTHFRKRIEIYSTEQFKFKVFTVDL